MKFKIEAVYVPSMKIETVEGKVNYVENDPTIRMKGYKNRDEVKLVETTEITIQLSGLPKELQDLWENFKMKVEDWVKEGEEGAAWV